MDDLADFLLDLFGDVIGCLIGQPKDGRKVQYRIRIVISVFLMIASFAAFLILMMTGQQKYLALPFVVFLAALTWFAALWIKREK